MDVTEVLVSFMLRFLKVSLKARETASMATTFFSGEILISNSQSLGLLVELNSVISQGLQLFQEHCLSSYSGSDREQHFGIGSILLPALLRVSFGSCL